MKPEEKEETRLESILLKIMVGNASWLKIIRLSEKLKSIGMRTVLIILAACSFNSFVTPEPSTKSSSANRFQISEK